jgi:hypothetical protein
MITREDLERADRCTAGADCPAHRINGIHSPLVGVDVIVEALEQAMPETWDGETSFSDIAARWTAHMATAHGAHCADPHCSATAGTPAYVGALRRAYAIAPRYASARVLIADLAHELGVDLDG